MTKVNFEQAVAALQHIVKAIKKHPGSGQRQRLTGFLAGLYHGERFPFDMTELRGLDGDLSQACLLVLAADAQKVAEDEIHHWGVFSADELNQWLLEDRHYYLAQARRIARELYEKKHGERGHRDQGLTG